MSFDAGSVISKLKFPISGWKKSVNIINKDQKKLQKVTKVTSGVIKKLGGALAGIGLGLGLKSMISDSIKTMDKVQKLSIRLGETTEFLSEMEFVADRAGVSIESMRNSIERANRRLAEFSATGKGEAAVAVKELNLQVRDATGRFKTFEQLLPSIADGFDKITTQQEKSRIAFQLFGREGIGFLQLLDQGSKGIEEMRRRARELGVTITQEMANKAAHAADVQTDWNFTMRAFSRELTINVLPVLNKMITTITTYVPKVSNFFQEIFGSAMERQIDRTKLAIKSYDETLKNLRADPGLMQQFADSVDKLFGVDVDQRNQQRINEILEKRKKLVTKLAELQKRLIEENKPKKREPILPGLPNKEDAEILTGQLKTIVEKSQTDMLQGWNRYLKDVGLNTRTSFDDLKEWLNTLSGDTRKVIEENYNNYVSTQKRISDALKNKMIENQELIDTYISEQAAKQEEIFNNLSFSLQSHLSSFINTFISNIETSKGIMTNFGETIKAAFKSLFQSILQEYIDLNLKMISQKIALKLMSGRTTNLLPVTQSLLPFAAEGMTFDKPTIALIGDNPRGPERVLNPEETKIWEQFNKKSSIIENSRINSNNIKDQNIIIESTIPGIKFYEKNVKDHEYNRTRHLI